MQAILIKCAAVGWPDVAPDWTVRAHDAALDRGGSPGQIKTIRIHVYNAGIVSDGRRPDTLKGRLSVMRNSCVLPHNIRACATRSSQSPVFLI
jgi:hypothetical protein